MPGIERGPLKRVVQAGTAGAIAVAGIFGGASDGGRILTQALNTLRNPGHSADDPQFSTRNTSVSRVDAQSNTPEKYQIFFPGIMKNFRPGGVHIQPIETPTPEPTATPDTRPSYPWPQEVTEELNHLPVLEGIRFGYYTDYNQIPYADIKAIFTPQGGANADMPRRMVHLLTHQELNNMWVLLTVGHELGHFHQGRQSQLNGVDIDSRPNFQQSYIETPEGEAFVAASKAAIANAQSRRMDFTYPFPWQTRTFGQSNYEDAADVISIWYLQPTWLDGDVLAPIRAWSQQWLPKK